MKRSSILTLTSALLAALAIMTSSAAAQTATGQITILSDVVLTVDQINRVDMTLA